MHTIEMSVQEQEQAIETARQVGAEFAKLGPQADKDYTFAYASAPLWLAVWLVCRTCGPQCTLWGRG